MMVFRPPRALVAVQARCLLAVLAYCASTACSNSDESSGSPLACRCEGGVPDGGASADASIDGPQPDSPTPGDAALESAVAAYVCEALRLLAGTTDNASSALQKCVDDTPAGGRLELPAGVYWISPAITVSKPLTLTTEGKRPSDAVCALSSTQDCAELKAIHPTKGGGVTGALLNVADTAPGTAVDHLVFDGNRAHRVVAPAGQTCPNVILDCDRCSFTKCVSREALCAAGLLVSPKANSLRDGLVVTDNIIANNGYHKAVLVPDGDGGTTEQGVWADGLTAGECANSAFERNQFVDNTDVDVIFGGCQNCVIRHNTITHSADQLEGSFAALMLKAWKTTTGNYSGSTVLENVIDCGDKRQCGFGILLGGHPWATDEPLPYGGAVHHNTVLNAQVGFVIDDVRDFEVYNNAVANVAGEGGVHSNVGDGDGDDYCRGTDTPWGDAGGAINVSQETLGAVFKERSWNHCIPNWWK